MTVKPLREAPMMGKDYRYNEGSYSCLGLLSDGFRTARDLETIDK